MINNMDRKTYEEKLYCLKLWTLEERRNRQDLIEVIKGTLHSVEKTLIQKAYCVYYYILKERRFFYVD